MIKTVHKIYSNSIFVAVCEGKPSPLSPFLNMIHSILRYKGNQALLEQEWNQLQE